MSNRRLRVFNPPNNYIMFDGKALSDFGIRVSGAGTYGSPERDVTEEEVPGRNGSLIFDNGRYKNADITYKATLLGEDQTDYTKKIEALRSFLGSRIGYKRLEDTYRMGEYRLASYTSGLDPDETMLQGSEFNLKFNCKPQRFLKTGERTYAYTSSDFIYNPTYFNSQPLIRVYGSGTVTIGDYGVTIVKPTTVNYVDVDVEMMSCYSGSLNCNDSVTLTNNYTYPFLAPEKNDITLGEGITKIEITPRWYTI